MRGLFITFEGVEGAGKTRRAGALEALLVSRGQPVVHTREPGGTPAAERIREILLDPGLEIPPVSELMLYLASRAANVQLVIGPALESGKHVVCERFDDATMAYQSGGRGLPAMEVREACRLATGGLVPDLTFILDLDPETGLSRLEGRGGTDRIEREAPEFHRRVRRAYLELAGASERYRVIDAALPWEEQDSRIAGEVLRALESRGADVLCGPQGLDPMEA
ncbi:dTMP kinase [Candidatus Fermentibacteria bacterium]|nr:dTMP kinase [Candidatus Fermentibacteria bacterium]